MIAKEYGAWSMLLMAFVLGPGVAAHFNVETGLFLGVAVALFLARYPLSLLLKRGGRGPDRGRLLRWTGIYSSGAILLLLPLLFRYRLWGLIPLGAAYGVSLMVYLYMISRKQERTIWGELWAVAGLSLAAPGAYYAATGLWGKTALLLWLFSLLYSGASVFYVPMKFRHRTLATPGREQKWSFPKGWRLGRRSLLYLGIILLTVGLLALGGQVPSLAPLAFLPLAVKTVSAVFWVRPASIRRIGFTEVAHVALFALLLIGAYRFPLG
ncbi:MAG: YwiC-like family protein [Dehalococcoidia bacterium]